jgi:hypothetical protein
MASDSCVDIDPSAFRTENILNAEQQSANTEQVFVCRLDTVERLGPIHKQTIYSV